MRLKQHLERIEEKVSKKEKQEALKNDNILIGCEFEFKLDTPIGDNSELEELYERAYEEYNDYNNGIDEYERAYEKYIDEIENEKEKLEDIDNKISDKEEAIELSEEEIDNNKDEIKNIQSDVKHNLWEPKPKGPQYDVKITTPEQEIEIIKKKIEDIKKLIKKWEREKDDLERENNDLEEEIRSMEEDIWEQTETHHPVYSKNAMPSYFEYVQEYMGIELPDYIEPGEELEHIPYEWNSDEYDDIESAVESSGILNNAPFNDYEIGSYGEITHRPGST
jgi:chromosome segregation ATPase